MKKNEILDGFVRWLSSKPSVSKLIELKESKTISDVVHKALFDSFLAGLMFERKLGKNDCLLSRSDINLLALYVNEKLKSMSIPGSTSLCNEKERCELVVYLNNLKIKLDTLYKGGGDFIICKNLHCQEETSTPEEKG